MCGLVNQDFRMAVIPVEKLYDELFEELIFNDDFPGEGNRLEVPYRDVVKIMNKVKERAEKDEEFATRLAEGPLSMAFKMMMVWFKSAEEGEKEKERILELVPKKYWKYLDKERTKFVYNIPTKEEKEEMLKGIENEPVYDSISVIAFWVFDPDEFGEPEVLEVINNRLYINGKFAAKPVMEKEGVSNIKHLKYYMSEEDKKDWNEIKELIDFYEPIIVIFDEIEEGLFKLRLG